MIILAFYFLYTLQSYQYKILNLQVLGFLYVKVITLCLKLVFELNIVIECC